MKLSLKVEFKDWYDHFESLRIKLSLEQWLRDQNSYIDILSLSLFARAILPYLYTNDGSLKKKNPI
jgi:hypothetical protein